MKHLVSTYSVDVFWEVCSGAKGPLKNWYSPLAVAAMHGHCLLIDWLIDAGATLTFEPLVACYSYSGYPHGELCRTVRHLFEIGIVINTATIIAASHFARWLTDFIEFPCPFPGSWWIDGAKAALTIAEKIKNESPELLPLFSDQGMYLLECLRNGKLQVIKVPPSCMKTAKDVLEWIATEWEKAHERWMAKGPLTY
jgi:hypothetical protein